MLYPIATNLWELLILRVLHGITFGIITTVKGTICAELIPASRRGEGLSYFSMAMSLAMVFGPYIGLKFANVNAFNTAFIVCMIVSAVNILLALLMKVPEKIKNSNETSKKSSFSWNDIFDRNAAPFALATFILACAYSGVSAFLSLYAKSLGMVEAASSFFIIYAVFVLVSRPFTGRWSDKFGTKVIIYPCLIIFAVGMLLLSQTRFSGMMLLAGALPLAPDPARPPRPGPAAAAADPGRAVGLVGVDQQQRGKDRVKVRLVLDRDAVLGLDPHHLRNRH
jgi:predicted MFS family arabinose efflux permease